MIQEDKIPNSKKYDLAERTINFAKEVRIFVKNIPKTLANFEDAKQAIRSSGSIGANYIEGNESLGKKDFIMKIKICRKEAKECRYWLYLLDTLENHNLEQRRQILAKEATELLMIFSAIVRKLG